MSIHGTPRWAPLPPPANASRAARDRYAAEACRARSEMRWIWNEVCSGLDLTRRVVPTGTVTREPPRLGRITLGPPTRFTVELRPGQLRQDVGQWSTRIAAAYGVPEVAVDDLVHGWIVVELVERLAVDDAVTVAPDPLASPPPLERPARDGAGPGPRRPYGRPRSWRTWRPRRHDV